MNGLFIEPIHTGCLLAIPLQRLAHGVYPLDQGSDEQKQKNRDTVIFKKYSAPRLFISLNCQTGFKRLPQSRV